MKTPPKLRADKVAIQLPPMAEVKNYQGQALTDLGVVLSADEIRLVMEYRCLSDIDRKALFIFAEVRKVDNPRKAELCLVSGGSR